jgi:hypothetical protein
VTRASVLPHRTTANGVAAEPWVVMIDGERLAPGVRLAWDRAAPLDVTSTVRVDVDRAREECGLGTAAQLRLVAVWRCTTTSQRGVGAEIVVDRSATYPITVAIDPRDVAGEVTLSRLLVLDEGITTLDPLTASTRGAVLWREPPRAAATISIDGGAGLSTEAVDFGDLDETYRNAPWRIDADLSDLHAAPMRALRLLVNSSHPTIERLLAGVDDDTTKSARSVLRWDVARRLLAAALDDDAFVEGFGEHPVDSVGGVLQALFATCLPGSTPRELRRRRNEAPSEFESWLQDRMHLLRNP